MEASYEITFEIALTKKPHTIEETLLKSCMMKIVNLVLEEASSSRCSKYPCQIILYRGAFLNCLWM